MSVQCVCLSPGLQSMAVSVKVFTCAHLCELGILGVCQNIFVIISVNVCENGFVHVQLCVCKFTSQMRL